MRLVFRTSEVNRSEFLAPPPPPSEFQDLEIPSCIRNSNPSNPPVYSEFQAKEPPMYSEFQNATRGRGTDIFWNYPMKHFCHHLQGIFHFWSRLLMLEMAGEKTHFQWTFFGLNWEQGNTDPYLESCPLRIPLQLGKSLLVFESGKWVCWAFTQRKYVPQQIILLIYTLGHTLPP